MAAKSAPKPAPKASAKSVIKSAIKSVFKKGAPSKSPASAGKHSPIKSTSKPGAKVAKQQKKFGTPVEKSGHHQGTKEKHKPTSKDHKFSATKHATSKLQVAKQEAHKPQITKHKNEKAGKDISPVAGKPQSSAAPKNATNATGNAKGGSGSKSTTSSLAKHIENRLKSRDRGTAAAHGGPVCREPACDLMATTLRYCRLHYIKNWKKVKRKELILKEKKLDSYIEELVSKYPEKYIDAIRQDLASEKDFAKVISELEIEDFTAEDYDLEASGEAVVEDIIDTTKRPDFDDDDFGF